MEEKQKAIYLLSYIRFGFLRKLTKNQRKKKREREKKKKKEKRRRYELEFLR